MKYTLFSLTIFSFLSFSALHSEEPLISEEQPSLSLLEAVPAETFDSEAFFEEFETEVSALESELLGAEEVVEQASPEISTNIEAPIVSQSPGLFSSLEEGSNEPLASSPLEEEMVHTIKTRGISEPFFEDPHEETAPTSPTKPSGIEIDLSQIFAASPFIYSLLLILSLGSVAIWLYAMSNLKYQGKISRPFTDELRNKLQESQYQDVLALCKDKQSLLTQIIAIGVSSRKHGMQTMIENMKAEGKRATVSAWQRLNLLQDVAIVAPMLGLLGTVLGMFYAFYDLNRSFESIANLFDGFGIAVGTTVAGIGVAILAMILHSTAKFRLVQALARVENEATSLIHSIDEHN